MKLNVGLGHGERAAHVAHTEGCQVTQGPSRLEDTAEHQPVLAFVAAHLSWEEARVKALWQLWLSAVR